MEGERQAGTRRTVGRVLGNGLPCSQVSRAGRPFGQAQGRLWGTPSFVVGSAKRDVGHPTESGRVFWRGKPRRNVGLHCIEELFGGLHGLFGFHDAYGGDVVEGTISLAAHAIEQHAKRRVVGRKVTLGKLDDGYVMTDLDAGPLPVAEHEC